MEIKTLSRPGFEEIVVCRDPDSGLRALIAIHDTTLGPALGGIRMLPYVDEEEALKDVLDLARAMTYKAAASHLKLGGGKAVIMANPITQKTNDLLKAMGKFVNQLKGRYIAAKDAGITTADLVEMSGQTKYITGLPEERGGSGDPSPWTAIGILEGIRATMEQKLGKKNLEGLRVAIQGVGAVGSSLARLLHKEKTKLILADTDTERLAKLQKELGADTSPPEKIHSLEMDVFAPCALGGIINEKTVRALRCTVIAGGANNQLADETKMDEVLLKRGILYAPDYIVNAGGLINIYVKDIAKQRDSLPAIRKIHDTLREVFQRAAQKKIATGRAANQIVEEILSNARGGRANF